MTGFNVMTETRYGPMLYNRNDLYLGRSLALYGEFLPAEIALLTSLVKPGDVVIDCGANIGDTTIPLAQAVGSTGYVFAYEPQRLVYQTLCANVALNSLVNVIPYWSAVGEKAGELRVPCLDPERPNNFTALALGGYRVGDVVNVHTLDSLSINPSLIKIDVEGMERQVLIGAKEMIFRARPVLYMEAEDHHESDSLIADLYAMDYRAYWFQAPFFNSGNFKANPENVFGEMASTNLIAVPQERFWRDHPTLKRARRGEHPRLGNVGGHS